MKLLCTPLGLLLACGLASGAVSVLSTNDLAAAAQAGTTSLGRLKEMVTPRNYQWLGFHSADEVQLATTGSPMLVYSAEHGKLRSYVSGQAFHTLLEPAPRRVIIPILAGGEVRSSTTLQARLGAGGVLQWTPANWGQPRLIRELTATARSIPQAEIKKGSAPFAVEVPVFDVWLIGYYNPQDELVLRATVDLRFGPAIIPRHGILTPAAMRELALAALRYNGLPN